MKKKGLKLVFLTAVISGFSVFINKLGVTGINPYIFTFGKNVIAMIFLFSLILIFKNWNKLIQLSKKEWMKLSLIGLVGGSIPFLLFFKGLSITTSATGALIHKTMFIYVLILAAIFLREKINKKIFIGSLILLLCNFLILKVTNFTFNAGDALILLATLFWATENTISKHVLKKIEPTIVSFGRMFFGSLFIILFLLISGNLAHLFSLNLAQLSWIFLTSIFLFFYVITWYSGLKHVRVSVATSILLLGSPITTLLSVMFLELALSIGQILGLMLAPVGILLILKGYQPKRNISLAYE